MIFMIPDINQREWIELLEGTLKPPITSFSLQMKLNSLKGQLSRSQITMPEAINELYKLCLKYEELYKHDINKIFNV